MVTMTILERNFLKFSKQMGIPTPTHSSNWDLRDYDRAGLQKGKGVWELINDKVPKTAAAYIPRETLNI